MNSRDRILNKLRSARDPFPDAPPRPKHYLPVAPIDDLSSEGLLKRFTAELERLSGQVFAVEGDDAARACVLDLLHQHHAAHILSWDFAHIPVKGLEYAIRQAGIQITVPALHDETRPAVVDSIRHAEVGLTGAEVAVAATGTLVVSTAPGKGRLPTILAPVHIVVVTLDQIVARLEDWVARERITGLSTIRDSANLCFITGSSRTGDIEMILVLGVHGPGKVQVVVKR